MTVVDEPLVDQKAGWSSICRAGDHRMCEMAQARCTCACHGAPQAPPERKEPIVSEATVTALPSKPVAVRSHECDECDQSFASPNGLAIHRGRAHGRKATAPKASKPKAVEPKAVEPKRPANERQLLAIVAQAYHDLNGADVATCIDSAAEIIDAITNAGWRVVEA